MSKNKKLLLGRFLKKSQNTREVCLLRTVHQETEFEFIKTVNIVFFNMVPAFKNVQEN